MKKLKTIILDSSVIVKWLLPEEDSESALVLNHEFILRKLYIAAPMLLYYEIGNFLKSAVTSSRIQPKDALEFYENFVKLNFSVYSMDNLFNRSLKLALEFDISFYDASYLALAEELKIPLITADQKLFNKVKSEFIVKLEDYKF